MNNNLSVFIKNDEVYCLIYLFFMISGYFRVHSALIYFDLLSVAFKPHFNLILYLFLF